MVTRTDTAEVKVYMRVAQMLRAEKEYEAALDSAEKKTKEFADSTEKSSKRASSSLKRDLGKMRSSWRAYTVAVASAVAAIVKIFRELEEATEMRAAREAFLSMAQYYGIGASTIIIELKKVSDQTLSTADAIRTVNRALAAGGQLFMQDIPKLFAIARAAAVTTGRTVEETFDSLVRGIAMGRSQMFTFAGVYVNFARAQEEYAKSIGKNVTELTTQEAMQGRLNATLEYGIKLIDAVGTETYEVITPISHLKAEWSDLNAVVGATVFQGEAINEFFEAAATRLQTLQEIIIMTSAAITGFNAVYRKLLERGDLPDWTRYLGPWAAALDLVSGGMKSLGAEVDLITVYQDAFNEQIMAGAQAMGIFEDSVNGADVAIDEMGDAIEALDLDPIITQFMRLSEIQEAHLDKLSGLFHKWQDQIVKIETKFEHKLTKIQKKAQAARTKAWSNYYAQIDAERARHDLQMEEDEARHDMQMRHNRERFYLTLLQNERIYQSERDWLVAEGDVLAIERLDERYALEQQAADENFELQQRHAEELFRLQQRYADAQFRRQLEMLKIALDQQLREIEARRREEVEVAKASRDEDLANARLSYDQRVKQENESYAKSLERWAEHWVDMVKQTELGSQDVIRMLEEYFGPGKAADAVISAFIARQTREAIIRVRIEAINLGPEPTDGGRPFPGTRRPRYTWRSRQYGGTEVVTGPAAYYVEPGVTERVTFEPLSPIGGAVSLAWRGGAIPVHGTGQFDGMDLSGLGDSIAQGIVSEMNTRMLGYRGQRGY